MLLPHFFFRPALPCSCSLIVQQHALAFCCCRPPLFVTVAMLKQPACNFHPLTLHHLMRSGRPKIPPKTKENKKMKNYNNKKSQEDALIFNTALFIVSLFHASHAQICISPPLPLQWAYSGTDCSFCSDVTPCGGFEHFPLFGMRAAKWTFFANLSSNIIGGCCSVAAALL